KAVDILLKITKSRLPTSGNFSSYSNLGTLFLSSDNQSHIQKGISLKLTLIESASFDDYLAAIMGSNNYGENPKNIAQKFCDAILNELKHKYSLKELVELFVECS